MSSRKAARWSDLPPDMLQLISAKLPKAQNVASLALVNRAARTATQADLQRRKAGLEARAAQVAAMMRDIITAIPHLIGRAKRVAYPATTVPGTALTLAGDHHFEGFYTIAGKRYFVSMRWDGRYKIIVRNRGRLLIDVQLDGRKRLPKAVLAVGTVESPYAANEIATKKKAGLRMAGVRFRTVNYIPLYGGWHNDAPPPIPHLLYP